MAVQSVEENRQDKIMTVVLLTLSKSGKCKEFPIEKELTVIGRKTDADLRIPLNEISRTHCEISIKDNSINIRDLDSSNGTFINDEQVTEATLQAGDRLRIGPVEFTVQIDGEPKEIASHTGASKTAPRGLVDKVMSDVTATVDSTPAVDEDDFDIDTLEDIEELDVDDFSDLDLNDVENLDDSDELDVIDDLEEINDDVSIHDEEEL